MRQAAERSKNNNEVQPALKVGGEEQRFIGHQKQHVFVSTQEERNEAPGYDELNDGAESVEAEDRRSCVVVG